MALLVRCRCSKDGFGIVFYVRGKLVLGTICMYAYLPQRCHANDLFKDTVELCNSS